jgi:hypothetical protein
LAVFQEAFRATDKMNSALQASVSRPRGRADTDDLGSPHGEIGTMDLTDREAGRGIL